MSFWGSVQSSGFRIKVSRFRDEGWHPKMSFWGSLQLSGQPSVNAIAAIRIHPTHACSDAISLEQETKRGERETEKEREKERERKREEARKRERQRERETTTGLGCMMIHPTHACLVASGFGPRV
jgi:hypothetical protein